MGKIYRKRDNLLDVDNFELWYIEKYHAEVMLEMARDDNGSTQEDRQFWLDRQDFLDNLPWGNKGGN